MWRYEGILCLSKRALRRAEQLNDSVALFYIGNIVDIR